MFSQQHSIKQQYSVQSTARCSVNSKVFSQQHSVQPTAQCSVSSKVFSQQHSVQPTAQCSVNSKVFSQQQCVQSTTRCTINKQREIIALDRKGTQQQRDKSPTATPPGVRVNTRYINFTKGTTSTKDAPNGMYTLHFRHTRRHRCVQSTALCSINSTVFSQQQCSATAVFSQQHRVQSTAGSPVNSTVSSQQHRVQSTAQYSVNSTIFSQQYSVQSTIQYSVNSTVVSHQHSVP